MNAIDSSLRTQVIPIDAEGQETVAFAGNIIETGEIISVIETREIGSTSSLAFFTVSIESINSSRGDTFSDAEKAFILEDHMQELTAVGVCLLLILGLGLNAISSSKKKRAARRAEMMQQRSASYTHEQNFFGRSPPQF